MNLLFCGTPDFAIPTLESLIAEKFAVDLVVTNQDEPSGRGYELKAPPVKQAALRAGLQVYQPARLKDPATVEFLSGYHPDAIIVVAYGHILPKWMIDLPPLGNINDRPLGEILHDPESWRFYWTMTARNDTCASCSMVGACGGGSRSASRAATGDWFSLDPRCSGDPVAQGFIPVCFMLREDLTTHLRSGFAEAIGSESQWTAESALRAALRSRRMRILTQFNALSRGVKFLVDLRADLLRLMKDDPSLRSLDRELEAQLTTWFDVGFLELQRISWRSPALLLEKLIKYEAVHEIRSWNDLKNRLDSDRRCYAFFHPCMPMEPLIFVEVALVTELAGNVQMLLDEKAPLVDSKRAKTAIFYSISNTQAGLRGVSFGNFLLKRVVDDLKRNDPNLARPFAA